MPTSKEFTVLIDDRPGTLGKVCRALADRSVNILAFQSFPIGGKSVTRFAFDNPTTAKTILDNEHLTYTEAEVAQVKLPHRPGEIARVASRLGEADININYAYCGLEPDTKYILRLLWCRRSQQGSPNSGPGRSRCCDALDHGK